MRTIAVISQKGGAGKTTLAVHLAALASAHGQVALIVDTDPQATASRWSQWREGREPEVIDCGAPSLLGGKLNKAEELGAFHHATARGLTAGELEPGGKAALEVEALWMWT